MSFFFKRAPHVKFVGNSTEDASATPTLSAKAGDLILAWAVESGTTNLPTIPAGLGWVAVQAGVAGNASGTLVAYRKVVTDGEGHGTWGGTLRGVYYQAFRNVDWHDPIGAHAQGNNATNANITNSALTLETRNCMVATGALVTSGTGPGIRSGHPAGREARGGEGSGSGSGSGPCARARACSRGDEAGSARRGQESRDARAAAGRGA